MPKRRRLENAALALPVFGIWLMLPPIISIFNVPHRLFGLPVEAIYLFSLWVGLISATAYLSVRMRTNTVGVKPDDPDRSEAP